MRRHGTVAARARSVRRTAVAHEDALGGAAQRRRTSTMPNVKPSDLLPPRFSTAPFKALGRRLYLDTGVIRRRASTLAGSPLAAVSHTSILAVIELLAEIFRSDNEFRCRTAALRALERAQIPIDWFMPDLKVYCAFVDLRRRYDTVDPRNSLLRDILREATTAKSRTELRRRLEKADLLRAFEYFEEYDTDLGTVDVESVRSSARTAREIYEKERPPEIFDELKLPPDTDFRNFQQAFRASGLSWDYTKVAMMTHVASRLGTIDRHKQDELEDMYDRSLDPWLSALTLRFHEQALGVTPARNDRMDIAHLMYVTPEDTLVTTDRRFAALATAAGIPNIGPDSVVAGA